MPFKTACQKGWVYSEQAHCRGDLFPLPPKKISHPWRYTTHWGEFPWTNPCSKNCTYIIPLETRVVEKDLKGELTELTIASQLNFLVIKKWADLIIEKLSSSFSTTIGLNEMTLNLVETKPKNSEESKELHLNFNFVFNANINPATVKRFKH